MYCRLIKETDHEIFISVTGIEIPNAECVHIKSTRLYDKLYGDKVWMGTISFNVTFEDGRIVPVSATLPIDIEQHIFLKKHSEDNEILTAQIKLP